MKLRARRVGLLTTAVVTAIGALTFGYAGPASAVESQCPSNRFCVWTDADFQGRFAYFQSGASKLDDNAIGGYIFGNRISSVRNNTSAAWCLYQDQQYGGPTRSIPRYALSGYRDNTLTDNGWNDRASSVRPCPA